MPSPCSAPKASCPARDRLDPVRPVAFGNRRPQAHERIAGGNAVSVPRSPATDPDLDLDHRLQPVDVRTLEEADFDETHGHGEDSNRLRVPSPLRCAGLDSADDPDPHPRRRRLEPGAGRPRGLDDPDLPAVPGRARAPQQHRLRELLAGRGGPGRRLGRRPRSRRSAGPSSGGPIPTDGWGRRSSAPSRDVPEQAPGSSSSVTWTPCSPTAPSPSDRSGCRPASRPGPGVTDMKGGLIAGLHALAALRELGGGWDGLPFERITYVANPDEEIGSPSSTPHIREIAADLRRNVCPRVRPGERRFRVRPQGDRRSPPHCPRAGGSCRRRAGEGSERDRRRCPDQRTHPRPQRPLARRHGERRGLPVGHAAERRPGPRESRGRRPGRHGRRARRRPSPRSGTSSRSRACPTSPSR